MVVGCSHGIYADPQALDAVHRFKQAYKPHKVYHLGDFIDLSAFMGGSNGEGDRVRPDLDGGIEFLKRMEFTDVLAGNHEARLWRDLKSANELKVLAAETAIEEIETTCLKLHANLYPYSGIWQAVRLANWLLTHGTIYNENSARDMAEMYGNVMFAHTHKPMVQTGRRFDQPIGMSVGTLTRRGAMEYANTRRSTLGWGQAFIYGEYNDDKAYPQIHIHDGGPEWKLP